MFIVNNIEEKIRNRNNICCTDVVFLLVRVGDCLNVLEYSFFSNIVSPMCETAGGLLYT